MFLHKGSPMASQSPIRKLERGSLRLSAALIPTGVLISAFAGLLHPEGPAANDHPAVFAVYAESDVWTVVHLGQFIGMAVIVAGLVAMFFTLDARIGAPPLLNRFGLVAAVVALALYGVLQAVDGVALKQAVDAWAAASGATKTSNFAAAEVVRWLEWGVRSYQSFMLGLAFVLFGTVIIRTRRVSPPIGFLMALSGVAYLVQGWVIGSSGFSSANRIPTLVGIVLILVWSVWLLVAAFRAESAHPRQKSEVGV